MPMTLDRPQVDVAETRPEVRWHPHQAGIWLAYQGDRFVGMVEELWQRGFAPRTRLGCELGRFPTLDDAKAALEDEVAVE
ncbi:MAG: hypothetical protein KF739_10045 [Cryobacterium sp.]|nr:hypothetical protein [Cryobacterium sp.]